MTPVISIKWQQENGKWVLFPIEEINHMSRDHALALFSGKIAVMACENGVYLTNREDIAAKYRGKGSKCLMFTDIPHSPRSFDVVGFLGGITV